jgi:glycosyltransferase involved in cell wall biosynthesis
MTRPLGVSIIIVNYNNERYLPVAIDSALAQDHALCEVIVVDDCSTDKSQRSSEDTVTAFARDFRK